MMLGVTVLAMAVEMPLDETWPMRPVTAVPYGLAIVQGHGSRITGHSGGARGMAGPGCDVVAGRCMTGRAMCLRCAGERWCDQQEWGQQQGQCHLEGER